MIEGGGGVEGDEKQRGREGWDGGHKQGEHRGREDDEIMRLRHQATEKGRRGGAREGGGRKEREGRRARGEERSGE